MLETCMLNVYFEPFSIDADGMKSTSSGMNFMQSNENISEIKRENTNLA